MEKLEHSSLSAYLRKLYGIDPLTIEEEVALHEIIKKGIAARNKLATNPGNEELQEIAFEGIEARNKLVYHNLRFVAYVLKDTPTWIHGRIPMEDLISEANEAMVKAAEKWVPRPGIKFIGYVELALRGAVTRYFEKFGYTIRIPSNAHEQIRKLKYNERVLMQQLLRDPTIEELSETTGISIKRIKELDSLLIMQPSSLDVSNSDKLDINESEE